jgi:hypothetical protein
VWTPNRLDDNADRTAAWFDDIDRAMATFQESTLSPQEWDWPPEGKFRRLNDVDAVPRRTGWASPRTNRFVNGYLRFLWILFKVVVGGLCGLALVVVLLVMIGLISAIN